MTIYLCANLLFLVFPPIINNFEKKYVLITHCKPNSRSGVHIFYHTYWRPKWSRLFCCIPFGAFSGFLATQSSRSANLYSQWLIVCFFIQMRKGLFYLEVDCLFGFLIIFFLTLFWNRCLCRSMLLLVVYNTNDVDSRLIAGSVVSVLSGLRVWSQVTLGCQHFNSSCGSLADAPRCRWPFLPPLLRVSNGHKVIPRHFWMHRRENKRPSKCISHDNDEQTGWSSHEQRLGIPSLNDAWWSYKQTGLRMVFCGCLRTEISVLNTGSHGCITGIGWLRQINDSRG